MVPYSAGAWAVTLSSPTAGSRATVALVSASTTWVEGSAICTILSNQSTRCCRGRLAWVSKGASVSAATKRTHIDRDKITNIRPRVLLRTLCCVACPRCPFHMSQKTYTASSKVVVLPRTLTNLRVFGQTPHVVNYSSPRGVYLIAMPRLLRNSSFPSLWV